MSKSTSTISNSPKNFRLYDGKLVNCSCHRVCAEHDIQMLFRHSPLCDAQIEENKTYRILFNDNTEHCKETYVCGNRMIEFLKECFGSLLRERILSRCSIQIV